MTSITENAEPHAAARSSNEQAIVLAIMVVVLAALPWTGVYPYFVMQALCFALFACAFNLLIGYGGLLSFGHAMFLGTAGYITGHLAKLGTISFNLPFVGWGPQLNLGPLPPELALLAGVLAAFLLAVVSVYIAIR